MNCTMFLANFWCDFLLVLEADVWLRVWQVGGDRKVQLLSRSLSGSRLNAEVPAFVPKGLQIAFSSSLPSHAPVLGFCRAALLQTPSSVIPVIIPPPPAAARETSGSSSGTGVFVPAVAEEHISESPPSMEKGPATKDGTDGADVLVDGGEGEQGQGGGAAAVVAQAAKLVVTEERGRVYLRADRQVVSSE